MKHKFLHFILAVWGVGLALAPAARAQDVFEKPAVPALRERVFSAQDSVTICVAVAPDVTVAPEITFQTSAQTAPAPMPQYWIGVGVENIGETVSAWLNLTPGQGLFVSKVLKDSPAQAAGLQVNDLLIEINGKPLMGQEQLIEAAQPVLEKDGPAVHPLTLVYQRGKDRHSVVITPQPRPAAFQVVRVATLPPGVPMVTNPQTIPNPGGTNRVQLRGGGVLEIGPGYRLDMNTQIPGNINREQIRQLMQGGQCVIISQSADLQGHVKTSITSGGKTYEITTDNLDALPADVRALAQSLGILSAQPAGSLTPPGSGYPSDAAALGKLIRQQQDEIILLQKQLDTLRKQLASPAVETQPGSLK